MRTGKLFFLFLDQNIFCGYSKEPSQRDSSFMHPKHMFKFMGKQINAILGAQTILIWTYEPLLCAYIFAYRAEIKLSTPGSAIRYVTVCATQPSRTLKCIDGTKYNPN